MRDALSIMDQAIACCGNTLTAELVHQLVGAVPAETLERVHAPLGFDIGSQTVPEIAISIVAELIAHRNLGTAKPAARPAINM